MTQSIRRGEQWWHRSKDGGWLLWSDADQTWEPQVGSPPPPPPPPPVTEVPGTPTPPTGTPVRSAPAHVPQQSTPGPSAQTEPAPAPAPGAAPAPAAAPVQAPLPAETLTPGGVALQAPPRAAPARAAEFADTSPLQTLSSPSHATLPPAMVQPAAPRPANGEVYSKGGAGFFSRFESRTLTIVGGALAIILIFVLTYIGATLVFRPSDDAVAAGPAKLSERDAFLMDVDELCSRASRSATGLPPPGDPSAMADFTRRAISTQRKLVTKMGRLTVPPKNDGLFRAILKESRVQIGHMHDLVNAAGAGDHVGTTAALERMASSEKRIDRMSSNYGFKDCG